MKKFLITLSVALCAVGSLKAQGPFWGMFDYAAKAGVTISSITHDYGKPRMGFYAGVAAEYYLDEMFSVQPEVVIMAEGGRTKFDVDGISTATTTKLTYLEIPVMMKFVPVPGVGLSFEAGPQLGMAMGANLKNVTNIDGVKTTTESSIYDNVNKVQIGLSAGSSYVLGQNFGVQLRYTWGLTNVLRSANSKVASRVFQLGAFYLF